MEIALGCITTIFGSRAAQRIAILMNLYGLKLNQDKVLQASIFLKPKARMISLRYVSKYHKFCIEDSTEGELFFDVKKLMTRGDLTPILFGSKVIFEYTQKYFDPFRTKSVSQMPLGNIILSRVIEIATPYLLT